METNYKTILIITVTISYILGICSFITVHSEMYAILCALILCAFMFLGLIKPKHTLFIFLIFIAGFINTKHSIKDTNQLANTHANNVCLYGRVTSIPTKTREGTRAKFYLDVDRAQVYQKTYKINNSKALVTINDDNKSFNEIQISDKIKICGNLREPKAATNPSQFDYAKYLKYHDTFSVLYSNGKNFEILSKADSYKNLEEFWWYILNKTDSARKKIIDKHAKYVKSPQLEILGGIVFGNEAINPPDEIKQSFINSGLLHLLAASGLNVALIFGIWWFLAQNLRLPYTISIWGGIAFVVLYTFMTGFPPSVIRASIMLLFVLLGKLIDRQSKPVALIFFVGFIMLIFDPKMFLDVGFQLSFIVTIGLISSIEPIVQKASTLQKDFIKRIKDYPKALKIPLMIISPKSLFAMVLVPLCAQLFVCPLQMYYFNTFTPWSLFANLCVVPFIGIISFLGFISSILGFIPFIGIKFIAFFDIVSNPLLVLLVKISKFFSTLKYSIITTPSPNIVQMLLFWIILILIVQNIKLSFKNKKILYGLLACVLVLCLTFIKLPEGDFEILAFDTGNSDCTLIKTQKNKYIMIDTGKMPYKGLSDAKIITSEYLKDKNIKELEILIITHFDSDHCGGAVDILNDFKVKKVYLQNSNPSEPIGKRILEKLNKENIEYKIAKNNEIIYKEDNLELTTYVANFNNMAKNKADNENSIITLVKSNSTRALFMADVSADTFSKIKELHKSVDILKVGHHGARYSVNENMLKILKPKYSIILGGYNTYGHPSYETVKLLQKSDTKVLLTRELGAIKISNPIGKTYRVEHFDNGFKELK